MLIISHTPYRGCSLSYVAVLRGFEAVELIRRIAVVAVAKPTDRKKLMPPKRN